jgi:hypothetical protein
MAMPQPATGQGREQCQEQHQGGRNGAGAAEVKQAEENAKSRKNENAKIGK